MEALEINRKIRNNLSTAAKRKLILIAIPVVILIAGIGLYKAKHYTPSSASAQSQSNSKSQNLDQSFNFPIYSQGQKTENGLELKVTTIERSDQVVVNGKTATSKEGKDFLIINIEIKNPTNDKLNVHPVDFFRLVDDSGNHFAADVYNDPVVSEPIAIKKTRIGYVVDKSQSNFKFEVGEINGEKQTVEVNI